MSAMSPLFKQLINEYRRTEIRFPQLKAITLAQWAVESAYGTSDLASKYMNFAGLKYRSRMEGFATPIEYTAHDGQDTYCVFANISSFISGYFHFIDSGPYEGWDRFADDPQSYLRHLARKGYAADRNYVGKVLSLWDEAKNWLGDADEDLEIADATSPDRFNEYVLKSVEMLLRERAGKGYDLHSYFTQDLAYGPGAGRIRANHPPLTMCVAAVTEVMVEALNLYHSETGDNSPFEKLPIRSWQRGSAQDIRAHIFQYDGTRCRGTAHALARFGIGLEMSFASLKPGDFITMNRENGSGHTAAFLSYLGRNYEELGDFSEAVIGFKYFSAQGAGSADAGLGLRWAFFAPYCPGTQTGKRRDCGIIRSTRQSLLNTGCLLHPRSWSVHPPDDGLTQDVEKAGDLPESDLSHYDGVTTD